MKPKFNAMKKTENGRRFLARISRSLAVGLVLFAVARANAAHELMYAIELSTGNLISLYSDAPGTILASRAVIGLQSSEAIRGIDMGPDGVQIGRAHV